MTPKINAAVILKKHVKSFTHGREAYYIRAQRVVGGYTKSAVNGEKASFVAQTWKRISVCVIPRRY